MFTLIVRDNATSEILETKKFYSMVEWTVHVDTLRRKYNNATVEKYFIPPRENDKPVAKFKTFH